MAIVKKISELTAKGSNIGANDLLIVGVSNGTDYDLKSVTGNQLLGAAVAQTITNGVTTTAPSQDAVFDALDLKVDKVSGSRLITTAEATVLSNTSGTNTGDETVTTIKTKLGITTLSGSNTGDQDISGKANIDSPVFTTNITTPTVIVSGEIASTIAHFDANKNVKSLGLGGYPSLTELSYVKGLTSPIQTQINSKASQDARVQTVTSSATVTPVSTNDLVIITAQAVGLTLANPTGTFTEGQALIIRVTDNGTARSIAYGTKYRGTTLPTTTVVGSTTYIPLIYNSTDDKFDNLSASGITSTIPVAIQLACSDETTALTVGTSKVTFRMPHAMTLTSVRASLNEAGTTSGITTIDINEGGTSILSTKLTIDLTEKTSTTAATPSVISDVSLADDAEITIDIDAISSGATEKGLKITLIGTRAV